MKNGGTAQAAQVDALDEKAVEAHIASVVDKAGTVDVSFNAITPVRQPGVQGVPIAELSVENFAAPIVGYMRSRFLTARAAARRVVKNAMEALNRSLSAEFGPHGISAVCLRLIGLPETHTIDVVFGLHCQGDEHQQRAIPRLCRRPDAPQALDDLG